MYELANDINIIIFTINSTKFFILVLINENCSLLPRIQIYGHLVFVSFCEIQPCILLLSYLWFLDVDVIAA